MTENPVDQVDSCVVDCGRLTTTEPEKHDMDVREIVSNALESLGMTPYRLIKMPGTEPISKVKLQRITRWLAGETRYIHSDLLEEILDTLKLEITRKYGGREWRSKVLAAAGKSEANGYQRQRDALSGRRKNGKKKR